MPPSQDAELDPIWFYGDISRVDAENLLVRVSNDNYLNGKYPNTLLVRNSSRPVCVAAAVMCVWRFFFHQE
jgi:hypothetical protein